MKSLIVEHHHGLSFCYNLNYGLENDIPVKRLKEYSDWFYKRHLKSHFLTEEKKLFPILGINASKVVQAIAEHRRLETLFNAKTRLKENLTILSKELDHHIRFEEKHLFPEILKSASNTEIDLLEEIHNDVCLEDWEDKFWD